MDAYSIRHSEEERKAHSEQAAKRIMEKAGELGLRTRLSLPDIAKAIQQTVEYGSDAMTGHLRFGIDDSAWACDASVNVELHSHEAGKFGVCAEATCNWSSSYRCVAMSIHAVNNYRKVIDFAAFVESYLR